MGIPATLSTVPAQTPYIQYVATSGQTVFPYPFEITQDSDLVAVANGTTLATDSGYTLSGVGNATGGNLTFTSGRTVGDIITLYRDIPIERLTQFAQNGGFSSTAFNAEFNNVYLLLQQLQQNLDQCLQIPNTNNPAPTVSLTPANYANKFLAFDAKGNPTPAALTPSGTLTQALIADLLIPQTAAEKAQGVTPTNFYAQPYTLVRYGADLTGTSDATTALQDAVNCAQQAGYGKVTVGAPAASLKVWSSWSIDSNTTGIDFEGAYIDATGFTTGNWLVPTQTNADPDLRLMLNSMHPIENATIVGPGATNTTAVALYLNDTLTPSPFIAGLNFCKLSFVNWGQDVVFGNGAFAENFDNCTFAVSSSGGGYSATTYSISNPSGLSNAGERNIFTKCAWYNKNYHINQQSGSSDFYFIGCSLDGGKRSINVGGGAVFLIGCHLESGVTNIDGDYWVYVTGTNSLVSLSSCQIVVDANKSVYAPFYSDVSSTNGGVFLDNCEWAPGANTVSTYLIAGTGNCRVRNLIMGHDGAQPTMATALNTLAYGGFENANYTGEWTLAGGATRSSLYAHSGTYSLSLPAVSGTPSSASVFMDLDPGQYVVADFWYKFPSTAGATFSVNFTFNDKGGNTIGVGEAVVNASTAQNNWTFVHFKGTTPAPAGAIQGQLQFEVSGVVSGTQAAYIDDVIINVPE